MIPQLYFVTKSSKSLFTLYVTMGLPAAINSANLVGKNLLKNSLLLQERYQNQLLRGIWEHLQIASLTILPLSYQYYFFEFYLK